jgi:hypothetical protein
MGSQQASVPAFSRCACLVCCFASSPASAGTSTTDGDESSRLALASSPAVPRLFLRPTVYLLGYGQPFCSTTTACAMKPAGLPACLPACHVPCAMCDVELVAWAPVDLLVVPLSLSLPQLETVPHSIGVERGTRKPRCSPQRPSYYQQPPATSVPSRRIPSPPTSPGIQIPVCSS